MVSHSSGADRTVLSETGAGGHWGHPPTPFTPGLSPAAAPAPSTASTQLPSRASSLGTLPVGAADPGWALLAVPSGVLSETISFITK